jgi:hypothetical protein
MSVAPYVTDAETGEGWDLFLGDSCERMAEITDESVDFTIYSPPFSSLFTYSPSERDLGNSASTAQFIEHYAYIVDEILRVTKPGRLCAVHVQQIATQKVRDGAIGIQDFRGAVIQRHVDSGWIFHGEVTVWKDPQAQAIRTKSLSLLFATLKRDSIMNRPAFADYVLIFRKPGENAVPVNPTHHGVTHEDWIKWASPVWWGIRESNTLNVAQAREEPDERHICPLQLDLIERAVRLWTNPGELVLSPFAGIGSEGVVSVEQRRRFMGIELKASYWKVACDNLRRTEAEMALPSLFDDATA